MNVLTKGLIGLLFPIGTVVVYLLLTRDLRRLLRCHLMSSTIVFLAIAVPWHVLAALRNPAQGSVRGFLWFYFVNEQFLRYLNKRVPPGYDTVHLRENRVFAVNHGIGRSALFSEVDYCFWFEILDD